MAPDCFLRLLPGANSWATELKRTGLPSNIPLSIRSNREPLSNVTDLSNTHTQKLSLPKTTTEDGISIDFNPLRQNADSSIRSNREPLSNVTDSSDPHSWKLSLPKTTTEDEIKIDFNPLA
jgi:hypothetical protein